MLRIKEKRSDKEKRLAFAKFEHITVEDFRLINERAKVRKAEISFFTFIQEEGLPEVMKSELPLNKFDQARSLLVDYGGMPEKVFLEISKYLDFVSDNRVSKQLLRYIK